MNPQIEKIVEFGFGKLIANYLIPALVTGTLGIGTYFLNQIKDNSKEVWTVIREIQHTNLETHDAVLQISDSMAQVKAIQFDHETRIRSLERPVASQH